MLREFKIIVPLADNDGAPLDAEHKAIAKALAIIFDGVTTSRVSGQWVGPLRRIMADDSILYTVAAEVSEATDATVRRLAAWAANLTRQHTVYCTLTTGEVRLESPSDVALDFPVVGTLDYTRLVLLKQLGAAQ